MNLSPGFTDDAKKVLDFCERLSVLTNEGYFNARVCGWLPSGKPMLEWEFNGETKQVLSELDYELFDIRGFKHYVRPQTKFKR